MPLGFEVDAMILSSLGIFLLFWKCRFRFEQSPLSARVSHVVRVRCVFWCVKSGCLNGVAQTVITCF